MALEALIFDVDGTLADTEEAHRQSFNAAFERHGLGWVWGREHYRELLEVTGGKERMRAHLATLGLSPAERRRVAELIPALHADKTLLYAGIVGDGGVALRDGVVQLIDEALHAGLHLGIATTTTAANVDALLAATLGSDGVEMFDVIAAGDVVAVKKPAPDIYELALRTLGVPADNAVAFEDSRNGLLSARDAGLWTVITPNYWTAQHDFAGAGLLLPSLAGLTLDELTRRHRQALAPNRTL